MFTKDKLNFSYRFIGEDQLTREAIGELKPRVLSKIAPKQTIVSQIPSRTLEMLKEVEVYNTLHRAAIELPNVQTQVKSRNSTKQLWIWKVSRLLVKVSQ